MSRSSYIKRNCKHCNIEYTSHRSKLFCCDEHKLDYYLTTCDIKDNGCIEWTKSKRSGYGSLYYNGETHGVHRLVYEKYNGIIPDNMVVMHVCDNRACCNIEHLRLGTQQDNMIDKNNKNRGNYNKGEDTYSSKLSNDDVIKIVHELKNYKRGDLTRIAKEYNVSVDTIYSIRKNKTWTHIPR